MSTDEYHEHDRRLTDKESASYNMASVQDVDNAGPGECGQAAPSFLPPAVSSNGGNDPKKSSDCETTFFTPEDLKRYDGKGADSRVLLALNGKVYDVTSAATMYGPGGAYDCFAGRDATVGLATFSLVPSRLEETNFQLEERHLKNLKHWEQLYQTKYTQVGYLKKVEPKKSPKPSRTCFIV